MHFPPAGYSHKRGTALDRPEMKMKLLDAGDRGTVLGRGAKNPGLQGSDHTGLNPVSKGVQNRQIGHFAVRVDGDIDHNIALDAVGECR